MVCRASKRKTALVPVANGTEEMECVIIADVLRRSGVEVCLASVEEDSKLVRCSRDVAIVADECLGNVKDENFDLIAVPGGMPGAERLRDSADLSTALANHGPGGLVGAICAAPQVVLQGNGLFQGKSMTSHPAFQEKLTGPKSAAERVVKDSNLVTSQGPGTCFEFSLELVRQVLGEDKAKEVAGPMVLPGEDGASEQVLRVGDGLPPPCSSIPSVLVPIANGTEGRYLLELLDYRPPD